MRNCMMLLLVSAGCTLLASSGLKIYIGPEILNAFESAAVVARPTAEFRTNDACYDVNGKICMRDGSLLWLDHVKLLSTFVNLDAGAVLQIKGSLISNCKVGFTPHVNVGSFEVYEISLNKHAVITVHRSIVLRLTSQQSYDFTRKMRSPNFSAVKKNGSLRLGNEARFDVTTSSVRFVRITLGDESKFKINRSTVRIPFIKLARQSNVVLLEVMATASRSSASIDVRNQGNLTIIGDKKSWIRIETLKVSSGASLLIDARGRVIPRVLDVAVETNITCVIHLAELVQDARQIRLTVDRNLVENGVRCREHKPLSLIFVLEKSHQLAPTKQEFSHKTPIEKKEFDTRQGNNEKAQKPIGNVGRKIRVVEEMLLYGNNASKNSTVLESPSRNSSITILFTFKRTVGGILTTVLMAVLALILYFIRTYLRQQREQPEPNIAVRYKKIYSIDPIGTTSSSLSLVWDDDV